MKKIDFYEKKKALHLEMLEAIVALFEKAGMDEIDLCPDGEWQRNAYVLYCPDGAYSIQEFQVWKVRCREGIVEVLAEGDDYTDYKYIIHPTFDFKAELLSKGNRIEVLSPQSLREKIRDEHLKAANLYEK